jgi:starch-binding outer membrane protein, SusD/RagB family
MLRNISNYFKIMAVFMAIVSISSCKKDYSDPSRATQENVFNSIAGLTGVDVGLQRVYSLGQASPLYNFITINGLTTHEIFVLNQGNTNEYKLNLGGTQVDANNTLLLGLWTTSNKLIYDANNVIQASAIVADKGYASGLIAYATIFKVLSLGALAEFWEKVPDSTGKTVNFIPRTDGLNKAIASINYALSNIAANPISAAFLGNVPPGIDIVNTLHALKARYSLFAGNYPQALAEANLVDLTKKSVLNFEAANPNPIFTSAGSNFNLYQPVDSSMALPVGLQPDPADQRVPFYMALSGNVSSRFIMKGFFGASLAAIPIYLPGEMTLIKAESYANLPTPDLANALIELNKVVTKKPANDPFGVGANLPPLVSPLTQAQLLTQIYRNRCIELFMSGLRLEDMRRLNRPTSERGRNFMPYPLQERDNDPNTPTDPIF